MACKRCGRSIRLYAHGYCDKCYHHVFNARAPVRLRRRAQDAAKRGLGFVELNQPFPNSEAHHISKNRIIYLPYGIHHSLNHNHRTGLNMDKMNAIALAWLRRHNVRRRLLW
jgi:hypothetical protein